MLRGYKRKSSTGGPLGRRRSSRWQLFIFIAAFAAIGGYLIYSSFAASPVCPSGSSCKETSFDTESGWTSNNSRVPDNKVACVADRTMDIGWNQGGNNIGGKFGRSLQYRGYYAVPVNLNLKQHLLISGKVVSVSGSGAVHFGLFNTKTSYAWRPNDYLGLRLSNDGGSIKPVEEISTTNGLVNGNKTDWTVPNNSTWSIEYFPTGNPPSGTGYNSGYIKFTFGTHSPIYDPLTAEQQADNAVFDRFGFLNNMNDGPDFTAYMDDVSVNGTTYNFNGAAPAGWQNSLTNSLTLQPASHPLKDCWVHDKLDFGYSPNTNYAGGQNGEVGGVIWRTTDVAGSYTDTTQTLGLGNTLYASGKLNLELGANDSDFYLGWLNSNTKGNKGKNLSNFLGLHIGGPTRYGQRLFPEFGNPSGIGKSYVPSDAPNLSPKRITRQWWICYMPGGTTSDGLIKVGVLADANHSIPAQTIQLAVPNAAKSQGLAFNQFGVRNNENGGGHGGDVFYLDDLRYTVAPGDSGPAEQCGVADSTAPTVSLTAPAAGATVSGNAVTVSANASDNIGVVGVKFYDGNSLIGAEDTNAPYSVSWNTLGLANGNHSLKAVARDASTNNTTSTVVTVKVQNAGGGDTTKPTVSINSPANNSTVSGSNISISANASDNVAVAGVQFKLDGNNICAEDTTGPSPYTCTLDSTTIANGAHSLTAVARDTAGNTQTSAIVHITVNNSSNPTDTTAPSVPGNLHATPGSTTVALSWTASHDNTGGTGVGGYKIYRDGAYLISTDQVSYSDTGLSHNHTYKYAVAAYDNAVPPNLSAKSSEVSATTTNSAPVINITSPTANAFLKGTIAVTATATDDDAITSVQFKLNDAKLGPKLTAAPYSYSWDTKGSPSKSGYKIKATAKDADSHSTDSATIQVTVDNTKPTVSITQPAANAHVTGTQVVKVTAQDNIGVAGVQLKADNALLGTELTVAPYTYSWNTAAFVHGGHTLIATARDQAGNTADSAPINLTVDQQTCQDTTPPSVPTNLHSTTVTGTTVALAWNASTDTGCAGVAGYAIYRGATLLTTTSQLTYTDNNLTPGLSYGYSVVALDNSANASAHSPTVTVTTTAPPPSKPGDANGDGKVNFIDLSILLSHYGKHGGISSGDFNNDGLINFVDLSILLSHYGK